MSKIPGAFWVALIGALITLIGQYFNNYPATAGVILALSLVAKLIEVYWPKPEEPATARGLEPQREHNKLGRVLFGG